MPLIPAYERKRPTDLCDFEDRLVYKTKQKKDGG